MTPKLLIRIIPGLIVGCLAAVPADAQMESVKVVAVEARILEAPSTVTLVGTVQPLRRSRVSTELAGLVTDVPVRQGDRVSRGDVLCRLNSDSLRFELIEAKARLAALEAYHNELLAGTRPEELARLKALLDQATADSARWNFEMERIEKLYEGRVSNPKEYNETRAEYLSAERREVAARADYDLAVAGPRRETIARAAFEVAEQQAVVDRLESDLRKTSVLAPFAGYVTAREVESGEWLANGDLVVEMIDLSAVLVRVDVPESALAYVAQGDAARVKIDALKRTFDGRIKHIIRQADAAARTFPIEIELDNHEGLLAAGMFARATVAGGPKTPAVAVPKDAIVEQGGVAHVATIVPDQQGGMAGVLTGVTVGTDVGDWITITSGNVPPGTQIITRGNEHIQPFPTPVQIVDDKGNPIEVSGSDSQVTSKGGA